MTSSASPEFPLVPRERALTLPGGEVLTLRPVHPDDAARVEAFAAALSDRSLYLRTFAARRHVSAEDIAKLIQVDFRRDMAFVAVHRGEDGTERFAAAGRYVRGEGDDEAEFAMVVADAWQRKGLGRALLGALVEAARERGLSRIHGFVLRANKGMLALARRLGFIEKPIRGDMSVASVELLLRR